MTKTETRKADLPNGFSRIVKLAALTGSDRDLAKLNNEYLRLCDKGFEQVDIYFGRLITARVMGLRA